MCSIQRPFDAQISEACAVVPLCCLMMVTERAIGMLPVGGGSNQPAVLYESMFSKLQSQGALFCDSPHIF